MSSEKKSDRNPLPFEPRQKPKKKQKQAAAGSNQPPETPSRTNDSSGSPTAIPDRVSKRMIRRMALFSGIPTVLGLSSFFIFYWIVKQEWFKLPTVVVLIASGGLFGLGFLGLSYGLLSASWEEERVGGWLGLREFQLNFGRAIATWRAARKEAKGD